MKRNILIACLLLVTQTSCQTPSRSAQLTGRVHHVVICWLKEPGNIQSRQRVIHASSELRQIPGVTSVRVGSVLPDTRPTVDSSFDVALMMTFTDEAALRAYATHPQHVKIVNEVIKPLVARYVAYDFIDGK